MKKLLFLMIGITLSISAFAQQSELDGIATVDIPTGAEKTTKSDAISHVNIKFRNNKVAQGSISRTSSNHLFKIGDVLVALYTDNHQTTSNQLITIKKALDGRS